MSILPNGCGGSTELVEFGLGARRYDYDAAGELRAVEISDDFPSGPCMQLTYAYGELCDPLVRGAPAVCGRASSVGP